MKDENGEEKKNQPRFPVYLGSDGTLYDLHYIPILSKSEWQQNESLSSSKEEEGKRNSPAFNPDVDFTLMPKAEDFDNFFDYEQALLDWKTDIEIALGDLVLPNVMGRYYYRPLVTLVRQISIHSNLFRSVQEEPVPME